MNPLRRAWLARLSGLAAGAVCGVATGAACAAGRPSSASSGEGEGIRRGHRLAFPRDHGAHPETRIEWWYATGWLLPAGVAPGAAAPTSEAPLSPAQDPTHGFQITFFRSRVAAAGALASSAPPAGRFTPRHLLFAHAAVTDLRARVHLHAQRIARWNGEPASGPDRAAIDDADVRLGRWQLSRSAAGAAASSRWRMRARAERFALHGSLLAEGPPLLQGDAGFSRKGPQEWQASHYYSLPQLAAELTLEVNGQMLAMRGRAWLDHEWSDELMPGQAVGWDWIGINLFDGGALTAFRLRRADGSVVWAGGSQRAADPRAVPRAFAASEVQFTARRHWQSAATNASYPVEWQVHTPAGRQFVRALLEAQELDARAGTGAVYWEGLAELLDEGGRRVGLGYLEMTGYAAPLKLGRAASALVGA